MNLGKKEEFVGRACGFSMQKVDHNSVVKTPGGRFTEIMGSVLQR